MNVTLVTNVDGWKITVTDQLLTELAKDPSVILSGLAPGEIPELKAWAENLKIKLFTPRDDLFLPEKALGLAYPPHDLRDIDVLIIHSYGIDLGYQAQLIKVNRPNCKWVHVVHTNSQELAKYGDKEIHDHEHEVQLELCKRADMIIAIGPKVAEFYRSYRAFGDKVSHFTPGINDDLINVRSAVDNEEVFRIVVSATYYEQFFEAKGLDIAAKAIGLLQDPSYHILFLVKPKEDCKKLESRLETLLDIKQFTVERFEKNTDDLLTLLCRIQLSILPSRAEGFGTGILSALSADVPVLVGENTGFGMALKKLDIGADYIIGSDKPQVWADKIKEVRRKGAENCFRDAQKLREEYMEKYNKQKQCHTLVQKMRRMSQDKQGNQKLMKAAVVDHLRTVSLVYEANATKSVTCTSTKIVFQEVEFF